MPASRSLANLMLRIETDTLASILSRQLIDDPALLGGGTGTGTGTGIVAPGSTDSRSGARAAFDARPTLAGR